MAKTILLADDSITIQKIVNLTFSGEGIEVVTVGNGDAAIKKVHDIHPDVVLADIFMPGKNGYEVCEYIKSEPSLQRTPVILLVGAFEPFDSNEAARVQADGHLTKPFEIRVLLSAVNSLISATEKNMIEVSDHAASQPEFSAASITVGSSVQAEEEPFLPVMPDQIVEEPSPKLEEGLSFSPHSPPVLAEESLASESPVVGPGSELDQSVEQSPAAEFRDTEPAERSISLNPSTSADDFDPLGLYSSESVGTRLQEAEAPTDGSGFVVDIWESRATTPGEAYLLSELAERRGETITADTAVVASEQPAYAIPIETRPSDSVEHAEQIEQETPAEAAFEVARPASRAEMPGPTLPDTTSAFLPHDGAKLGTPALSTGALDQSELVDSIVQRVMERLSKEVIEKIAWEVVPDLAEIIIKEQLESHLKTSGGM